MKVVFYLIFPFLDRISKIRIDLKKCKFCGMCEKACPVHIITLDKERKTYSIEHSKCIGCMCCHEVCPHGAPYMSMAALRTMQRRMFGAKLGKGGLANFD